jgi:hypothetical protein
MAARARVGLDLWDEGCEGTTLTGGYAAMSAMRDVLESVIADRLPLESPGRQLGNLATLKWGAAAVRAVTVSYDREVRRGNSYASNRRLQRVAGR